MDATIHGAELPTGEVDIVYALEDDNLVRMASALAELRTDSLDFPGLETDDLPALLSGSDLGRRRTALGDLDMMTAATGAPPCDELGRRSYRVTVRAMDLNVAALNDLIAIKRTTGRHKDAAKLVELEELPQLLGHAEPGDP